jgi:hypothetical protein
MKKMTKKRAMELAVLALELEISSGMIQMEIFDDALECLEKYYNIPRIRSEFVETPEEFAKRSGGIIK